MPTPTYDLIEEKVLGSAAASVTFSSIPGTYKDLVLEWVGTSGANAAAQLTFNGDTGTNYSATILYGDGGVTVSTRTTNANSASGGTVYGSNLSMGMSAIQSYANTSVNKTVLTRYNQASNIAAESVSLWRSTSAINSLTLTAQSTTWSSGTTFRLWGVAG